jgi:hypothetical protein
MCSAAGGMIDSHGQVREKCFFLSSEPEVGHFTVIKGLSGCFSGWICTSDLMVTRIAA